MANTTCLPVPGAPFEADRLCVYKDGDVACSGTTYTSKRVFYTGTNDTRGCNTCTCGGITGASCAGSATIRAYSDAGCSSQIYTSTSRAAGTNPFDYFCDNTSAFQSVRSTPGPVSGTPVCSSSGGAPNGTVTPTMPTTVCCTP